MPAIRPQGTTPTQEIVHVARDANGHTAHAAREGASVARLHDQVHVVALHGKMHDAELPRIAVARATNSELNRREKVLAPQRPEPGPQRDMHGLGREMARAST